MFYDHEAVRKAYSNAVTIDDSKGVFDADGKSITIDASKVTAARTALNNELNATLYQRQRTGQAGTTDTIYPSFGDQLDLIFKAIDADSDLKTKFADFHTAIAAVKAKYPKPS